MLFLTAQLSPSLALKVEKKASPSILRPDAHNFSYNSSVTWFCQKSGPVTFITAVSVLSATNGCKLFSASGGRAGCLALGVLRRGIPCPCGFSARSVWSRERFRFFYVETHGTDTVTCSPVLKHIKGDWHRKS